MVKDMMLLLTLSNKNANLLVNSHCIWEFNKNNGLMNTKKSVLLLAVSLKMKTAKT